MTGDCCNFKFLRRSVDEKHLMRFESETSVFKFLRRSVGGTLLDDRRFNQYILTSTFNLPAKQMNDRFDKRDLVQPLTRPVEISLSPDETTRPQW